MNAFKKFLLALTVAILCAGAANAQFKFGIKAGLLVNKISLNNDLFKSDNSCGWTAGPMVEFTVPIIGLTFDAGLMYARMNNAADVTITTDTAGSATPVENNVYGKNFLEIPINLKYKFTIPVLGSIFRPYIFTGPNFAFRLDKAYEDKLANLKSRTCQVAWNVGLGFELVKHLQIGASYGFGINNIVDKVSDINTVDIKAKNNYWTVSAAYLF